ncbi:MAG TPA: hypothetical protein VN289_24190, partial [Paraburkholderia sp.]|nr:hypothetical protein [Paraburkholderia sp.]
MKMLDRLTGSRRMRIDAWRVARAQSPDALCRKGSKPTHARGIRTPNARCTFYAILYSASAGEA